MPRFRFQWDNIDANLREILAANLSGLQKTMRRTS
jgi:hypothetical protein